MLKEGKPLIAEVTTVAEAQGSKPSFLLVGSPDSTPAVKAVAASKKAHLNFSYIASLDGNTSGTLLFLEDGKVSQTLSTGGDVEQFVNENS